MLRKSIILIIIFILAHQSSHASEACMGNPVHLTFDDGPHKKITPQVLDILKKNNVPATFFILLKRIDNKPALQNIVVSLIKSGFQVGVHGYEHEDYSNLNANRIQNEFKNIDRVLDSVIINSTPLRKQIIPAMRLPYGNGWVNPQRIIKQNNRNTLTATRVKQQLTDRDWMHIGWHIDSQDYLLNNSNPSAQKNIFLDIFKKLEENKGGVILLHDTNLHSPLFLNTLIDNLKKRHYCFVGLDQFVNDSFLNIDITKPKICPLKKFGFLSIL